MSNINAVAPQKNSSEDQKFIGLLWDAFMENYDAFKDGKIKLEDEFKYHLFSAPGPAQYAAFAEFFGHFEDEEQQIWNGSREYMYMHDFADMKNTKPGILEYLEKLSLLENSNIKNITMVSGFFWGQHIPTRKDIVSHYKKLHKKNKVDVRVVTRAKRGDPYLRELSRFVTKDSHFNIPTRVPIHFVLAEPDYLFFEVPHTESTVLRLNILLDLNTVRYKNGKTRADLLNFLDSKIDEVL